MNHKKGLFITIEALDFAGKTTQIEKLKEWFEKEKIEVIFTREPGGTKRGEKIRQIILNLDKEKSLNSVAECYLYASGRSILVEEIIKPNLKDGKIIISDRFLDSSLAYQGFGRGLGLEFVQKINHQCGVDILPDLTIFLDGEVFNFQKRIKDGQILDRIEAEGADFQNICRNGFLKIIQNDPERFKIINANETPEKIFEQIKEVLTEKLRLEK